jgi:hypothetical protein
MSNLRSIFWCKVVGGGFQVDLAPILKDDVGCLIHSIYLFVFLTMFNLPKSPRWLVSKGRMLEAKKILQDLRGREDVLGNDDIENTTDFIV